MTAASSLPPSRRVGTVRTDWSPAVERHHAKHRSTRTQIAPLTAGTGEMSNDPGILHAMRADRETQ